MRREEIIKKLQNSSLEYKNELLNFVALYSSQMDFLREQYKTNKCSEQEAFIIQKLDCWIEQEGYKFFAKAIEYLNDDCQDAVRAFINLYELLFTSSAGNVEKIIDHLFYIPEQFSKRFAMEERNSQRILFTELFSNTSINISMPEMQYRVTRLGISNEVPFFINGGK